VQEVLGAPPTPLPELFQVIVHSEGGNSIGLVVDEILDIVEQQVSFESSHATGPVNGTAVIQKHVTDLFSLQALRQHALQVSTEVCA
jgi:hypothetical protein